MTAAAAAAVRGPRRGQGRTGGPRRIGAPRDGGARPERSGGRRRGAQGRPGSPERPPAGRPDAEQPYADRPYADQSYAEQPYAEQPYAEQPSHEEPGFSADSLYQGDPAYQDDPYGGEAAAQGETPTAPSKSRKPGKGRRPGGPGRPRRPGASRKGGPGAKLYFGAAAALAVLVVIGLVAAVALSGGGDGGGGTAGGAPRGPAGKAAGNGSSPESYSSSPSSSAYAGIASRKADAEPLTAGEAFPSSASKLSVDGTKLALTLRAKKLDGDCTAAVWGQSVAADLARGGCTQAARGIYSDTRHGYGLAVAVFNLASSADSDRFVGLLDRTLGGGFVVPLPAAAPLDRFGQGFGMARGLAMGHYAVVAWAQRLDGKGDASDGNLLSLLIEGGKAPSVLGRAAAASH
ncbi:hypothetical protein F8568_045355 [Actinomadura sp. LD22]|uniref:Uncharacterized protein n=1 Tax=Actinomadura physcomitrii TaxID=2650748 RepID=A0A6I4MNY3_9ACTN|nr:hypothetical protein [Actinomadura physcomitrii]MWA07433.1 hypothetical protein [Actinomadura physcomitrii]